MFTRDSGETPAVPIQFVPRPARPVFPHKTPAGEPAGRTKLWQLDGFFFCSILGTCLGTGELRKLVARATGEYTDKLTDLEVHERAVRIAGKADSGGRLLHKALDERHQVVLRRFDRAKTPDEVRALWDEAQHSGDIPGGYWALMTHRAATRELRSRVFGEVHMLSHLVGAANRADIRRLARLESENAALVAKTGRQEARLRESISARDETIRRLRQELAEGIVRRAADTVPPSPDTAGETARTLRELIVTLQHRLEHETARRKRTDSRLRTAESSLASTLASLESARLQQAQMAEELRALEARLADGAEDGEGEPGLARAAVAGRTLLYVGGRPKVVQVARALVERDGGVLLHHDGRLEARTRLLAGDIHRADLVLFPVDCVSHEAVTVIKRTCGQADKPFVALRSAGVASFLAALSRAPAARGSTSAAADP